MKRIPKECKESLFEDIESQMDDLLGELVSEFLEGYLSEDKEGNQIDDEDGIRDKAEKYCSDFYDWQRKRFLISYKLNKETAQQRKGQGNE